MLTGCCFVISVGVRIPLVFGVVISLAVSFVERHLVYGDGSVGFWLDADTLERVVTVFIGGFHYKSRETVKFPRTVHQRNILCIEYRPLASMEFASCTQTFVSEHSCDWVGQLPVESGHILFIAEPVLTDFLSVGKTTGGIVLVDCHELACAEFTLYGSLGNLLMSGAHEDGIYRKVLVAWELWETVWSNLEQHIVAVVVLREWSGGVHAAAVVIDKLHTFGSESLGLRHWCLEDTHLPATYFTGSDCRSDGHKGENQKYFLHIVWVFVVSDWCCKVSPASAVATKIIITQTLGNYY